jgi:hypothetical protein
MGCNRPHMSACNIYWFWWRHCSRLVYSSRDIEALSITSPLYEIPVYLYCIFTKGLGSRGAFRVQSCITNSSLLWVGCKIGSCVFWSSLTWTHKHMYLYIYLAMLYHHNRSLKDLYMPPQAFKIEILLTLCRDMRRVVIHPSANDSQKVQKQNASLMLQYADASI